MTAALFHQRIPWVYKPHTKFNLPNLNILASWLLRTALHIDDSSPWKCSACPYQTTGLALKKAMSIIQTDVETVQSMEFGPKKLEKSEQLLQKYAKVLHHSHYIQTNLRQNLIEMYGKVTGYELQTLPVPVLEQKIEMCINVLEILDRVQPGKFRMRAFLLYEMHGPLVLRAKTLFNTNKITNDQFVTDIKRAIFLLKETIEILEWEDVMSVEAKILTISKNTLKYLEEVALV